MTMKQERLNDDDLMPFGKYAGKQLIDVPDDYFRWFLSQKWCKNYPMLVEYANVIIDDTE
jgi:uncharacterized protein (DUF3820 family)